MILPPFTPGGILFELLLFVVLDWIARYEKERQERAIRKALEGEATRIQRELESRKSEAAKLLVRNWESNSRGGRYGKPIYHTGYGFVYAYVELDVIKETIQTITFAAVPDAIRWRAQLIDLDFKTHRQFNTQSRRRPPKPSTKITQSDDGFAEQRTTARRYPIRYVIEEPIFTPFDYLLGELETLKQLLAKCRRILLGRPAVEALSETLPPAGFANRYYQATLEHIDFIQSSLSTHRALEEKHPGPQGIIDAASERKLLLFVAEKNAKLLDKLIGRVYQPPRGRGNPAAMDCLDEARGLARNFQWDVAVAKVMDDDVFEYRTDPTTDFIKSWEKRRERQRRWRYARRSEEQQQLDDWFESLYEPKIIEED